MTLTIRITEHGRVWPVEEVAALGEISNAYPINDQRMALEARGFRVTYLAGLGRQVSAEVEHDVPAVTGESVTLRQLQELFAAHCECRPLDVGLAEDEHSHDCDTAILHDVQLALGPADVEARARCAAAINARRGAR